ncbi:MAG: hypothetical protein PHC86_06960 [Eubacteriales bacterium]|nr:hypothetical protein [Eubacteriales bacterium]
MVARCVNPDDGRSSLITISELGRQKVEAIFPEHLLDLDDCFSGLTTEEKLTLQKLLKK